MHASFVLILLDAPLPQFFFIILQGIAGATGVSNFLRAFRILGVDEKDPSQFWSVFKMELFMRPLLLLLQLGIHSNCLPDFWP